MCSPILIVHFSGQTCFPFDDSTTMGELIGNTSDNVVQLTIFTRTEADKFGISKDYEEEVCLRRVNPLCA